MMGVLIFGVCRRHRLLHQVAKLGSNIWQAEQATALFLIEHLGCRISIRTGDDEPALVLVDEHQASDLEDAGYYQRPPDLNTPPAEVTEPLVERGTLTARAAVKLELTMESGWPMAPARLRVVNRSAMGRVAVDVTVVRGAAIIGHEVHDLDTREEMEVPISGRSALDA